MFILSSVQVLKVEAQLSERKDELLKLRKENNWMLFFHTPKLLLLYKEIRNWTLLSCLCGSKDTLDMKEKMQGISHIIESETDFKCALDTLSVLQACSTDDWFQFLQKVLPVCKKLSDRAVRHIVREISVLCPVAFDVMKSNVEVGYMAVSLIPANHA